VGVGTMYVHIAIYQWRPGTSDAEVDRLLQGIRSLTGKVPGLSSIHVGKSYSPHSKHFTHAIVVLGESQGALDAYRAHPDHHALAEQIDAVEQDGIGVDFIG